MKRTYEDMWFAKDLDICETCLDAFHITGTYISQGFSCSSPVGRAGLLMPEVLTACSTTIFPTSVFLQRSRLSPWKMIFKEFV
jgi:hypothetical protein